MTPFEIAKSHIGTWEWKQGHNPKILKWFADVGHEWVKNDETAWCAAFVGAVLKEAQMPHTGALNARSYTDWGDPVEPKDMKQGDVAVFWRGSPTSWKGHVGFVDHVDSANVYVLGGNQSNQVNVKPYPLTRLLAVRRMPGMQLPKDHVAPVVRQSKSRLLLWLRRRGWIK